jgi:broad specificity phosphatase PhoE
MNIVYVTQTTSTDNVASIGSAELAFDRRNLRIRVYRRLRECNYSDLDVAPKSEVDTIRASRVTNSYRDGESYEDVTVRTRAMLENFAGEYPRGTVRLIGHHTQRVAFPHLADGVPLDGMRSQTIETDWWQHEWEYRYGD